MIHAAIEKDQSKSQMANLKLRYFNTYYKKGVIFHNMKNVYTNYKIKKLYKKYKKVFIATSRKNKYKWAVKF